VFELSLLSSLVAPRRGRWSNSLLAILSTGVIALVVWLVIVFFSVTEGLEKGWLGRLTALHGDLRITPASGYFEAYGTRVQSWSERTGWRLRSLPALWRSAVDDPYDPQSDGELPPELEQGRDQLGAFPVRALQESLRDAGLLTSSLPYQASVGVLHLHGAGSSWTQPLLLAAWEPTHPRVPELVLGPSSEVNQALSQAVQGPWPLVLPKAFRDSGAREGDRGVICYSAMGAGGLQERKLPIRVVGFYDAGVMPVGGKIAFLPSKAVEELSSSLALAEAPSLQGVQVFHVEPHKIDQTKAALLAALQHRGCAHCWKLESYRELEFAQELFQQFQSDRLLFSLIALIVLAVACANIVSFLILLVQERRREIGILRAMGAQTGSLAAVFGGAGMLLGVGGAIIGSFLAALTLANLDHLVAFLSYLQGHPAFHAAFFGGRLPNTMSLSALQFVWIATPVLAFCSGLVPAWRACRLEPSIILKNQ
jgi:lipoprotein-releasing system permease protein